MADPKDDLNDILTAAGLGVGATGTLVTGGALALNKIMPAIRKNKRANALFDKLVADRLSQITIGGLDTKQQQALKTLGVDIEGLDKQTPIKDLTAKVNNTDINLMDVLTKSDLKTVPKDIAGIVRNEAIQRMLVPAQQHVLTTHQKQTRLKQVTQGVASEHRAAGGSVPVKDVRESLMGMKRTPVGFPETSMVRDDAGNWSRQPGRTYMLSPTEYADPHYPTIDPERQPRILQQFSMTNPDAMGALKLGAMGHTYPGSSLVTNENFANPGLNTSFNQIAQQLPPGHPSATTGLRFKPPAQPPVQTPQPPVPESFPGPLAPPMVADMAHSQSSVPPQVAEPPAVQLGGIDPRLPQTPADVQEAFVKSSRARAKAGTYRGTPLTKERFVRGVKSIPGKIINSPAGVKWGTGLSFVGSAVAGYGINKKAEEDATGVQQRVAPSSGGGTGGGAEGGAKAPKKLNETQQQAVDFFDAQYSGMSMSEKIKQAQSDMRTGNKPNIARVWLNVNGPKK